MRRQFMYGTIMAVGLTVGLGAQSTPPQSYPQDKPQSPTSEQDKSTAPRGQALTLVGCLQSGNQSSSTAPTGTAGTTPSTSSASSTQFVLKDATQSASEKPSATGTAGTTASSASIPSTISLRASGSSADWSRYLNHKVEVKGTLDHSMGGMNPSSTSPSSTNPSSTSPANPPSANPTGVESPRSTGGTMSSSDMGPTFRVSSIKEVSGTCSASK